MQEPKWQRIQFMPGHGIGENGERVTGCKEHIALSRKAAAEGMVLLKNEDSLLPLGSGQKLAVFGKAQADYVKGGGGSGDGSDWSDVDDKSEAESEFDWDEL